MLELIGRMVFLVGVWLATFPSVGPVVVPTMKPSFSTFVVASDSVRQL